MKSHLLALLAATFLLGFLQPARADTDITFQDFYDALTPDGDWVELEEYGYCWRPFVDDHWRPYTDGQWVYTDAGYTWLSNEPWGWATYHYGRWTKVKNWGWVWVPGYEWGPAWVSWRTNDEYIGWAALPPEAVWEPSTGISVFVDVDYGIGPDWYAFCPVTYFCAPRLRTVCLPWRNNITIINNTVNITRIRNVNNGIIFNDGPDINVIKRRAESPLRRARLEREGNFDIAALREGRLKSRLEGDTLKIPAPRVDNKDSRPTKIAGRAGSNQINRGWEEAVKNPELVKAYRDKIRAEAEKSGRKPHKELTTQLPQDQPPQSRPGIVNRGSEDVNSRPGTADGSTPVPAATPRNRRNDLQDNPPTQGDSQRQQREEELRNRILEQRQQQNQELEQRRQRLQEQQQQLQERQGRQQQQQQQSPQQPGGQEQAAENARRQQAEQARDKALRAQQEFEARREAARQQRQGNQQESLQQQQQQQEAARQQLQQRQQALEERRQQAQEQQRQQAQEQQRQAQQQLQQQQQQQQSQMQQLQQQMQQQRQERQQQRQERRQGN